MRLSQSVFLITASVFLKVDFRCPYEIVVSAIS